MLRLLAVVAMIGYVGVCWHARGAHLPVGAGRAADRAARCRGAGPAMSHRVDEVAVVDVAVGADRAARVVAEDPREPVHALAVVAHRVARRGRVACSGSPRSGRSQPPWTFGRQATPMFGAKFAHCGRRSRGCRCRTRVYCGTTPCRRERARLEEVALPAFRTGADAGDAAEIGQRRGRERVSSAAWNGSATSQRTP